MISDERAAVVAEAMSWDGTPFVSGAMIKGAGVDCAHLLVAAFAPVVTVQVPKYPPDWFLHSDRERLLEMVRQFCVTVETPDVGDIATFKFGRATSHAGIIVQTSPTLLMIHAFRPTKGVVVDELGPDTGLSSRFAGYYRLTRWSA